MPQMVKWCRPWSENMQSAMKKINGKMKTFEETVMKKPKEFSKPGVEKFYFLEPKKHFKSELFHFSS